MSRRDAVLGSEGISTLLRARSDRGNGEPVLEEVGCEQVGDTAGAKNSPAK
jgi:hypothetical protein